MMLLLSLSMLMLMVSLKSNSPLSSAMFLILSLVATTPILSMASHTWYVYLMLMLFLGGIFILVVYFSSLCSYLYKEVSISMFFVYSMLFSPWTSYGIGSCTGVGVLFNYSVIMMIMIIILVLTSLMLFSSYMLSSSSALRNM